MLLRVGRRHGGRGMARAVRRLCVNECVAAYVVRQAAAKRGEMKGDDERVVVKTATVNHCSRLFVIMRDARVNHPVHMRVS